MPNDTGRTRKSTSSESLGDAFDLLGTARGQILTALCGQRLTAIELGKRFSISSNAIRAHLRGLKEAGLVRFESVTRGVGKPTHMYELTASGQYLVSRAYVPALTFVIGAAREHVPTMIDEILRDAGRALASARSDQKSERSLKQSAKRCVDIFRSLGGRAKVVDDPTTITIRSECCPLAAVVTEQPSACKLLEGLACAVTGHEVREHCERGHGPHCQFVIMK